MRSPGKLERHEKEGKRRTRKRGKETNTKKRERDVSIIGGCYFTRVLMEDWQLYS